MKRFLLLFGLLAVGSAAMAQVNGGLQGPAAKNYKYWLDDNKPVATEVVSTDAKPVQGPAAKNKNWHNQNLEANYITIATITDRPHLVGPKAKRSRPFDFSYTKMKVNDSKDDGQEKDSKDDQENLSTRIDP